MLLAHAGGAGEWGFHEWVYLVAPITFYSMIVLALLATGRTDDPNIVRAFFRQISDSLHRVTGIAGWAMAGVLSALLVLLIAVIGFYWDVAWHIDLGRDAELFTPSHVMILVGLGGLIYAAGIAVLFATIDRAETGLRFWGLTIPWSSLGMAAAGAGGVAAFPLDALWHKMYGLDITLWSPSHLQLVAGGSFGTIAAWLMMAEALPGSRPTALGRLIHLTTAGATLVGMSTFQGEFDFGAPQFQILYLPLLVMAAAGFVFVIARIALGPWGALKALAAYLVLRLLIGALVAGDLGHTYPRFPLYLVPALLVEAVGRWVGTRDRLRFSLFAGLSVGTIGLVAEMVTLHYLGDMPVSVNLLWKTAILGPIAACAAAVIGGGLARAFSRGDRPIPVGALLLAGVGLIAVLLFPLPRNTGDVSATISLDREGDLATVHVLLDPPDAAEGATVFAVTSWQGGGTRNADLEDRGGGRYTSSQALPITGRWKTMVSLQRGDEVMAAPVYMPADPEIGASAVPALPERRVTFVRNTTVLLREAHDGPLWPSILAFTGLGLMIALWAWLFSLAARKVEEPPEDITPPPFQRSGQPAAA